MVLNGYQRTWKGCRVTGVIVNTEEEAEQFEQLGYELIASSEHSFVLEKYDWEDS